jgi:hypothetical protein
VIGVVTIEGVLADGQDLRNSPPTKWAKPLYDGMRSQFNLVLLTSADHEIARWWLRREALASYSQVLCWKDGVFNYPAWRIDQMRQILADGWEVAFYLDSNPDVLSAVGELGVITLAVSYPGMHVGWRASSSTAPRAWSEVVDTVGGNTPPYVPGSYPGG